MSHKGDAMERKKRATQEDIANLCKIDQGSVSRILNEDTRDSFAEVTVQRVFRAARELGYLHPALVTTDRRESARKRAVHRAKVVILIGTNTTYDEGAVDVTEVSTSGMLLKNFRTSKNNFPMDRFRFDVAIQDGKLKGFACRCRMVRFSDNENEFAVAVKYDSLDETSRGLLKGFVK